MTPSEKEKVRLAGFLLALFLAIVAFHSGEIIRTGDGCQVHFHDLRGARVFKLELSPHHLPRVQFH